MTTRTIILVAAMILLSACKSLHTVEGEYHFQDNPKKGLVIIATRVKSLCPLGSSALIFNLQSGKGQDNFSNNPIKHDGSFIFKNDWVGVDFNNPPGYFLVRPLDEGEYMIDGITGYSSRSDAARTKIGSSEYLDIPFTVTAGKTTYLGEVLLTFPNCFEFTYRFTDQWARDRDLFRHRVKNIDPEQVEKQVPARYR